jgi:hypothetical protein
MCSTGDERLTRLGQAIEDLAAAAQGQPHAAADDQAASRVADIWAMLAELDPELASRMARYHGTLE